MNFGCFAYNDVSKWALIRITQKQLLNSLGSCSITMLAFQKDFHQSIGKVQKKAYRNSSNISRPLKIVAPYLSSNSGASNT